MTLQVWPHHPPGSCGKAAHATKLSLHTTNQWRIHYQGMFRAPSEGRSSPKSRCRFPARPPDGEPSDYEMEGPTGPESAPTGGFHLVAGAFTLRRRVWHDGAQHKNGSDFFGIIQTPEHSLNMAPAWRYNVSITRPPILARLHSIEIATAGKFRAAHPPPKAGRLHARLCGLLFHSSYSPNNRFSIRTASPGFNSRSNCLAMGYSGAISCNILLYFSATSR